MTDERHRLFPAEGEVLVQRASGGKARISFQVHDGLGWYIERSRNGAMARVTYRNGGFLRCATGAGDADRALFKRALIGDQEAQRELYLQMTEGYRIKKRDAMIAGWQKCKFVDGQTVEIQSPPHVPTLYPPTGVVYGGRQRGGWYTVLCSDGIVLLNQGSLARHS